MNDRTAFDQPWQPAPQPSDLAQFVAAWPQIKRRPLSWGKRGR